MKKDRKRFKMSLLGVHILCLAQLLIGIFCGEVVYSLLLEDVILFLAILNVLPFPILIVIDVLTLIIDRKEIPIKKVFDYKKDICIFIPAYSIIILFLLISFTIIFAIF